LKKAKGPDFMGIGPPKTATSWMYDILAAHPETSMPPMKEIGYWWAKEFLPEATWVTRFQDSHWFFSTRRSQIVQILESALPRVLWNQQARKRLAWSLRYALLPHNDAWYDRLFDGRFMSGDITPKYCELGEKRIATLARRYPRMKIIVSLRDPVEREWSRAKMNLCSRRGRAVERVPHEEWIEHFNREWQAEANDYAGLIERWTRQFSAKRIHFFFFEEVVDDPWSVFLRLCEFLELGDPPESLRSVVARPRNVGRRKEIPARYASYLFTKHRKRIEAFVRFRPDLPYPRQWLEKYGGQANAGEI